MVTPAKIRAPHWLQHLSVGLIILAGVTITAYLSDWTISERLEGDPLEVYARVKLAADHPLDRLLNTPRIASLGVPGPADWSDYPVPDRLVFVVTGQMSRLFGLIAATQLMSSLILGLNAVSFFFCARWLRCRWEWAAGLAVVFAFCNYNVRWGITLSLSQTFVIPPLILLCALATRHGPKSASAPRWLPALAAAMGIWLGMGNPYLAYFAGVVGGGALLLAIGRRIPRVRFMPLACFLGAMSAVVFASHATFIFHQLQGGAERSLVRDLGDLDTYSLNPVDWIVPPVDHRIPAMGLLGGHYLKWRENRGEFFYNYLGWLGLAGVLGLTWRMMRRIRRSQWSRLDPAYGILWITAFGVVGGINYWLGFAGMDLFRASTRIGIYALVWVLLFFCGWLSRRTRAWPRLGSIALAGSLTFAACWESTLPLSNRNYRVVNHRRWILYENLADRLQRELPPGAAIFQMPVLPFPEAGRQVNLPDYEHLLPFLASTNLRFSYGNLRHDPLMKWAKFIITLPPREMITVLENTGFSALIIDERGYADSAQALRRNLQAANLAAWEPVRGLPYLHIYLLHPAARPSPPDLNDPRLLEAWDAQADPGKFPRLLAEKYWYPLEHGPAVSWRWAAREAVLGVLNGANPTTATLHFRLDAPAGSIVTIRLHDQEIWRGAPGPQRHELHLSLTAGLTSLVWQLEGKTFRPGDQDPRELGFMVENPSVSVP